MDPTYVVVGGGIAGVTCVESLAILAPEESVTLVTASTLIKNVSNVGFYGKTIVKFDVQETEASALHKLHPNLNIVYDCIAVLETSKNRIITQSGTEIGFKFLCICTGGVPKLIPNANNSGRILGIRDTDSVKEFRKRILDGRRMVVVGNGGIASEVVFTTNCIERVWIIRDDFISATFIDPGASEFFQHSLSSDSNSTQKTVIKRQTYSEEDAVVSPNSDLKSAALGPDWCNKLNIESSASTNNKLEIIYKAEIVSILENANGDWPLTIHLSNNKSLHCDFVVSATGVTPALNFKCDTDLTLGPDGGIVVDEMMTTSQPNIFAAGDVAHAGWEPAPNWFQMRLWTQARQMGSMAAKAMHARATNEPIYQDFCFELFTHTTKLYGYQVVLLGKYNGQGLGKNYEILIRTTPKVEYIKFVLVDNKLQGAILIGETGLEEMCENLILNQLDLSPFGDDILNPDIDIDDYFD